MAPRPRRHGQRSFLLTSCSVSLRQSPCERHGDVGADPDGEDVTGALELCRQERQERPAKDVAASCRCATVAAKASEEGRVVV
jgi:hypothetical protein